MRLALPVLALVVACPMGALAQQARLEPAQSRLDTGKAMQCERCHFFQSWRGAKFAHERTGFPLLGAHQGVPCLTCHPVDFAQPVSTSCASCHRDAHVGELGQLCASCHDEQSWRTTFTADAHRRTNFPLTGRHAFIPCQECHPNARDRSFTRGTVDCAGCHLADYQRTDLTGVSHQVLGFGMSCRHCHDVWRFTGARFSAHDGCFLISRGPHSGISCLGCHGTLAGALPTGACQSLTAGCTLCHSHSLARTEAQHQGVPGYQFQDRKCYECHRFEVDP